MKGRRVSNSRPNKNNILYYNLKCLVIEKKKNETPSPLVKISSFNPLNKVSPKNIRQLFSLDFYIYLKIIIYTVEKMIKNTIL